MSATLIALFYDMHLLFFNCKCFRFQVLNCKISNCLMRIAIVILFVLASVIIIITLFNVVRIVALVIFMCLLQLIMLGLVTVSMPWIPNEHTWVNTSCYPQSIYVIYLIINKNKSCIMHCGNKLVNLSWVYSLVT